MEMAGAISSAAMQNIAIGFLDIKDPEVKSVVAANRNQKMLSYELLQIWRNKRPENNREVGIKNINTGQERLIRTRLIRRKSHLIRSFFQIFATFMFKMNG